MQQQKGTSLLSNRAAILGNLIELQQDIADIMGRHHDDYKALQDTFARQCGAAMITQYSIIIKKKIDTTDHIHAVSYTRLKDSIKSMESYISTLEYSNTKLDQQT